MEGMMKITDEMVEAGCAAWVNLYPGFEGEKPQPTAGGVVKTILTAALSASPAGVVKPLEFKYHAIPPTGESLAQSVVGLYCIQHGWQNFRLRFRDSETLGDFKTIEEAEAKAQSDYSARIMSAIEPAGVGVETEADDAILLGKLKVMRGVYAMQGEQYTSRALHNIITEFEASRAALKGDEQ